jgi:uncharacterized protein
MLTIAKLFGKSPFAPLQTHMNKVASCLEKLTKIFDVLAKKDIEVMERLVGELSNLEHEADLTKNDIRNHLPKSLFMPIDRAHFLEILSIQDSIADKAEDIGILLTLRPTELFKDLKIDIQSLFKKNAEVFWSTKQIIEEIDELLESSFGGLEAEKVKSMVELTAYKEYEAEKLQRALMKQLFTQEDALTAPAFYLWLHLIEELGELSHICEKLANRIRMVLELK